MYLIRWIWPLKGNQDPSGLSEDLLDLLLQVFCVATLQEQVAVDSPTSLGFRARNRFYQLIGKNRLSAIIGDYFQNNWHIGLF